jgi:hypothetical protein
MYIDCIMTIKEHDLRVDRLQGEVLRNYNNTGMVHCCMKARLMSTYLIDDCMLSV